MNTRSHSLGRFSSNYSSYSSSYNQRTPARQPLSTFDRAGGSTTHDRYHSTAASTTTSSSLPSMNTYPQRTTTTQQPLRTDQFNFEGDDVNVQRRNSLTDTSSALRRPLMEERNPLARQKTDTLAYVKPSERYESTRYESTPSRLVPPPHEPSSTSSQRRSTSSTVNAFSSRRNPIESVGREPSLDSPAPERPSSRTNLDSPSSASLLPPSQRVSSTSYTPTSSNAIVPQGLRNMGNTCYMNAALQCILHGSGSLMPQLKSHQGSTSVGNALVSLYDLCTRSATTSDSMSRSLMTIKSEAARLNSEFVGGRQNDSHEFIRECLHSLHKQTNRVKKAEYREIKDIDGEKDVDCAKRWFAYHKERDDSIVYDVFGGFQKSVAKCTTCHYRSLNFDPILDLSLQLAAYSTSSCDLLGLLKDYTKIENLRYDADWICSKCKTKRDAARQVTLSRWPQTLVLHLKRFSQSGRKNACNVKFPAELPFDQLPWASYGILPGQTDLRNLEHNPLKSSESQFYSLSGIVMHHGTSGFGHYTAFVKPYKGTSWFECDDGTVRKVSDREVLSATSSAYVLFYSMA